MTPEFGHVVNARFPHAAGTRGKKRPVVVVQAEPYNRRLKHAVVAQLTTNLSDKNDPACLLIEAASAQGRAAGIAHDSLLPSLFRLLARAFFACPAAQSVPPVPLPIGDRFGKIVAFHLI